MAQQHFKAVDTVLTAGSTPAAAAPSSADNGAPNDGVDVSHGEAFAAVLSALSAQTITSGTLKAYVYMPVDALGNGETVTYRWMRYPTGDWTVTGGTRDEPSGDKYLPVGVGRVALIPDAMVFSGGATCKLTYSVRRRRG